MNIHYAKNMTRIFKLFDVYALYGLCLEMKQSTQTYCIHTQTRTMDTHTSPLTLFEKNILVLDLCK